MTDDKHLDIHNYDDIRPYDDSQVQEKLKKLVSEPGFEHAVKYVMPDVDYPVFAQQLQSLNSRLDFQLKAIAPFLDLLAARTTDGLSMDGTENYDPSKCYTFITNHRDIVLDASFLNLCLIKQNLPITQVAIGNNLLIYEWITDLVKLNGSFIVKRDTGIREALDAAKHLSEYIHLVVGGGNQSIWIAQREGRAKDSNDLTQESVIKMLALAGGDDALENLLQINLIPVAISYEYDPNDYLKVREFLLRRRDPEFRKSQRDDLFSMETGILKNKGRVHFRLGRCINEELAAAKPESRAQVAKTACSILDRAIHCGYKIYPCNYIAYDELNKTSEFSEFYTPEDVAVFHNYVERQLAKVDVENVTSEEREFMQTTMLTMYANPLRNQLAARDCQSL